MLVCEKLSFLEFWLLVSDKQAWFGKKGGMVKITYPNTMLVWLQNKLFVLTGFFSYFSFHDYNCPAKSI